MALPNGWIATGITVTHSLSCTINMKACIAEALWIEGYYLGASNLGAIISLGCAPGTVGAETTVGDLMQSYIRGELDPFSSRTTLDSVVGTCAGVYFAEKTVTKTAGPFIVGVTLEHTTGTGDDTLRYSLFGDSSTNITTVIAGVTVVNTFPYAVPTFVGNAGILIRFRGTNERLSGFNTTNYIARIQNIQANSEAVSLTGILPPYIETSSGVLEVGLFNSAGSEPLANVWGAPYKFDYDIDVTDAGGTGIAADVTLQPTPAIVVTAPATGSRVIPNTSWNASFPTGPRITAALNGTWLLAQTPTIPTADEAFHTSRTKPKAPAGGPANWLPVVYTIASPLSVLLSSNLWVAAGAASVAGSVFTVTGAGASVTRQMKERWRNWNNSIDPDYHADDGYTTTKHDYYAADGQDVWGWGLYAYLDVGITCPAASTLTLTVTSVLAGASPALYTRTYTLTCAAGANTIRVDLLFPNEQAVPFYFERVDTLKLEGFGVGVYTLTAMQLVAVEQAYVKAAPTGGYPGCVVSQDGAFPMAFWGTNPLIGAGPARRKDDESGLFTFDAGEDSSAGGCVRMDGTILEFATEWNRMEGMTVTYDNTAMEADLSDGSGNVFGLLDTLPGAAIRYATWVHANLPAQRATANIAASLAASIRANGYALCAAPAGTFKVVMRKILGTVLEGLCVTSAGARAGTGDTVQARRNITGVPAPADAVVGTGTVDASGYVTVPVRNGTIGGSAIFVYLQSA